MSELEQPTLDEALEQTFEPEVEPVVEEAPEPSVYRVGGREYTEDQMQPIADFVDWAQQNPDSWQQLQEWEHGRKILVDALDEPTFQEPVYEPEDLYSEDHLRDLTERTNRLQQEIEHSRAVEGELALEDAMTRFVSKHNLSDQEADQVFGFVAERQSLLGIDDRLPYPRKMDAVMERLDDAYRSVFYNRAKSEGTRETVRDLQRRRRASSSSSSVSAPRVAPEPSNASERHSALVDDVRAALEEANH